MAIPTRTRNLASRSASSPVTAATAYFGYQRADEDDAERAVRAGLASLLSIPTGDRYPPLNLTAQKQKEKTLHALVAQVEGLAAKRPVLMVFEDVLDPTSLELLHLTVDRVASLSVLLIITHRPEFIPPWTGLSHVTLLSLNRLPPRQCRDDHACDRR